MIASIRHTGGCLHPAGDSVNARCLDPGTIGALRVRAFDGRHWEHSATSLEPIAS